MFEQVIHPILLDLVWHPEAGRYYCPVCISLGKPPTPTGWSTRTGVVDHLKGSHGWEEPEKTDALSHSELVTALIQWRKDTLDLADGFGASLRLVRGVDDFLEECEVS